MRRGGDDIRRYPLSADSGVQTGISYGLAYDEMAACAHLGVDAERWLSGKISTRMKAHLVAFYRLQNLVAAHSNDAQTKKMKEKSKH